MSNDTIEKLATKRAEWDKLHTQLDKSLILADLLKEYKVKPEWPVHLQFSGNVRNKDVFCTFKNRHGAFLRLHYTNVPEILYPEQLKKDLKL